MQFVIVALGFLAAIAISEMVLRGTKLQTGLTKVLVVHALVAGLLLCYFVFLRRMSWFCVLVFWSGAFLTWFGVRSHIESSILLRMLYLLRRGAASTGDLLQTYESHYGEALRLRELFAGGLLQQADANIIPTRKGQWILRIVSFLR